VIDVAELTTTPVAGAELNKTVAPLKKPVPVIVTESPPAAFPAVGEREVTTGAG
jgi:hypothetical protein